MSCDGIHPFEAAGLGQAPFALVGITENVYVACSGAVPQPGGTCDYCGTGIRYECHIESADGKQFKVGSDCVLKLERADNRLVSLVEKELLARKRAQRRDATARRKAVERDRIRAAFSRFDAEPDLQARLAAKPHPAFPDDPQTNSLQYVVWMRRNAGHTGQLRVARMIEEITP